MITNRPGGGDAAMTVTTRMIGNGCGGGLRGMSDASEPTLSVNPPRNSVDSAVQRQTAESTEYRGVRLFARPLASLIMASECPKERAPMSDVSSIRQRNQELASRINKETRANPNSPYAGKFVGVAQRSGCGCRR
jgi:hypothetical protein